MARCLGCVPWWRKLSLRRVRDRRRARAWFRAVNGGG